MNAEPIIVAAIVAIPPTLLGVAALVQAAKSNKQAALTHDLVNSRMTELLELAKKQSGDAATLEEKKAQALRDAAAAVAVVTLEKKREPEPKEKDL